MTSLIIVPFIILFIIPRIKILYCYLIIKNRSIKIEKRIILIIFILMYLILFGQRYGGGADDEAYQMFYEYNHGFSYQLFWGKEPVFNILRAFGHLLDLDYKWLFFSYSLLTAVPFSMAIYNYFNAKQDLILYIAAFLFIAYTTLLTTMRQAIVIALLFYLFSLKNISLKKRIIFWFIMICSHYGFILILPLEILAYKLKYKFKKCFLITIPITCYFIGKIINFEIIINFIAKYLKTFTYMTLSENFNVQTEFSIVICILFVLYVIKIANLKKVIRNADGEYTNYYNKFLYAQMMYFSLSFLTMRLRWGNRLAYYYILYMPLLIIDLINFLNLSARSKRQITCFLEAVFYVFFLLVVL